MQHKVWGHSVQCLYSPHYNLKLPTTALNNSKLCAASSDFELYKPALHSLWARYWCFLQLAWCIQALVMFYFWAWFSQPLL